MNALVRAEEAADVLHALHSHAGREVEPVGLVADDLLDPEGAYVELGHLVLREGGAGVAAMEKYAVADFEPLVQGLADDGALGCADRGCP